MLKVSMIVSRRAQIYILVFINLSLSGSLLTPFLMSLTLSIFALFLFVIDLAWCFFCIYFLCTWVVPPVLLINLLYILHAWAKQSSHEEILLSLSPLVAARECASH
jgi:hypothetical protein